MPPGSAIDALQARFPALADPQATELAARFARGEVVDAHGRPWAADADVGPGDELWFHRELREESVPDVDLSILHQDDHLLVLDKPHDMATMPRGAHVLASALVRLRRATGIADLVPLHRLDRRTAGVLAFGIRPAERAAYQQLFARGEVDKVYEARVRPAQEMRSARGGPSHSLLREGDVLRDHLLKRQGDLRTQVLPGEPNAETRVGRVAVEADGTVQVTLHPRTGRTHQLRVQLSSRGVPILGEDLYGPRQEAAPTGSRPSAPPASEPDLPLQLLARSLAFRDPMTGRQHRFESGRTLLGPTPDQD